MAGFMGMIFSLEIIMELIDFYKTDYKINWQRGFNMEVY